MNDPRTGEVWSVVHNGKHLGDLAVVSVEDGYVMGCPVSFSRTDVRRLGFRAPRNTAGVRVVFPSLRYPVGTALLGELRGELFTVDRMQQVAHEFDTGTSDAGLQRAGRWPDSLRKLDAFYTKWNNISLLVPEGSTYGA